MTKKIQNNTALIVDDEKSNRILARAFFELLGWTVDECSNATESLEYLRVLTPECILIDIKMPKINGIELAISLRKTYIKGGVKLIAYTAQAISCDLEKIRAAGFDDILVKPVAYSDFKRIFEK